MERLKPRDEVLLPDVRYRNTVNLDHSTAEVSEMTIDTIYEELGNIRLNETVPEAVRSHFEIARNLLVYSWFVYSFNVVAGMQAFASLEMAVRNTTGENQTPFKNLLDKTFKGRKLASGFGPPIELSKAISKLRNDLAHGSSTLHGQGLNLVGMCADLINELHPDISNPMVQE
jgi:hypothetical protein